jgi:hypothetical protein
MENKKNMDYILNTAKLISNEEVEVEKYLKAYKVFQKRFNLAQSRFSYAYQSRFRV